MTETGSGVRAEIGLSCRSRGWAADRARQMRGNAVASAVHPGSNSAASLESRIAQAPAHAAGRLASSMRGRQASAEASSSSQRGDSLLRGGLTFARAPVANRRAVGHSPPGPRRRTRSRAPLSPVPISLTPSLPLLHCSSSHSRTSSSLNPHQHIPPSTHDAPTATPLAAVAPTLPSRRAPRGIDGPARG